MRRVFIAFGIIVFLLYCWASMEYQNVVAVPGYRAVAIDLLGGRSRAAWEKDAQAQFQRLMELEGKNYQLPADTPGDADRPLTSDDFAAYIAEHPGQPVMMTLRDSGDVYVLLAHKYHLRDSIPDPAAADGAPLYFGGHLLDKVMLDDLRGRGVAAITVSGHAAPVNFQVGTALMIAVIFFTLAAALKPILWNPFIVMLEKRRRELDAGSEAERQNQQEAVRFEDEKRRRNAELGQTIQAKRLEGHREIAEEAGGILRRARDHEKERKLAGLCGLAQMAEDVRGEMREKIPELARAVADALTPGAHDDGIEN